MSVAQSGSRKSLSAKLLVKPAADTDTVTEDEAWTLSGWQEGPSVPESARAASAKLSKYKPAARSEPQQSNSAKTLLSTTNSSRSLNSPRATRSNVSSPARDNSASSSPSRRRANAGSQSASGAGTDSLRVMLQQQQLFGQARRRHQQRHWPGPGGEEETADDAAAGAEHYRPPPAAVDVDAAAESVDAAADASDAAFTMQQDHLTSNNSSSDASRVQSEPAQQQLSDGDGIMQGILNRLAAVPVGSSSPSKRRALRPTLSSSGSSSCSISAGGHAGQQSATPLSNAPPYSYSNTLVAGRFAHGSGQLGVSGNGFNSNMRQQSARSLTLGLAARAQMLLTRDLASSVTPRTPRGRMAELIGSVQPASPAGLCVDVRPGSAGGAGGSTPTGSCYAAGHASNAAEIVALAQQQQAAARRSSLDELLHMVSSKSNDLKVGRNDGISSSIRSKASQHIGNTSSGGRGGPPTAAAAAAAAAQRSGLQMMGSRAGTKSSA